MNTHRPLDSVASIKLKLGLLVGASVLAALLVSAVGESAGVPLWTTAPVTLAAALAVTLWLARGMTSPLVEMTGAATAMAGGDYTRRVTATSSDEVGMLARAFNAIAADLATADQQRRELVATVSHELRTPLAAQRALLENLADGVVRPDDAALRAALHQSERLSTLVTDLLDLSRIDAGAAPLRLGEVAVDDLLRRAGEEVGIGGRRIEVQRSVSPAGLVVRADGARLSQLVVNLVDNAVRHSPPGGTVRVDARARDGDSWVLEVRDDGPGIPAEHAERVFDRFGRGDDTGGGTGLGLAIASWVCTLHGGSVAVVPTPSGARGATLRAVLPLHPSTSDDVPHPRRPPPRRTRVARRRPNRQAAQRHPARRGPRRCRGPQGA
ncbi:MAG: HAMP domain-containing sensor histidine kinase [Dermatophilaceae bacterium]